MKKANQKTQKADFAAVGCFGVIIITILLALFFSSCVTINNYNYSPKPAQGADTLNTSVESWY